MYGQNNVFATVCQEKKKYFLFINVDKEEPFGFIFFSNQENIKKLLVEAVLND